VSVNVDAPLPWREVDPNACPLNGCSLLGAPIPEESRQHYGTATHFRREIGIETDAYDGMLYFVCPDCHGAWPRFTSAGGKGSDRLVVAAFEAVEAHNAQVALLADKLQVVRVLTERADEVAFALGMHGFRWTGWAHDTYTGAYLWLLVDMSNPTADMGKARALARDITGLPVALMFEKSPAASRLLTSVQPVPALAE
jgi:hypothetical protein